MPPSRCYPPRPPRKRAPVACLTVACALAVAAAATAASGCAGAGGSSRPTLTVFAAASLRKAFDRYATQFAHAQTRDSFAGSDTLAAQIEQGLRPDVFASADTALPERLYKEGLVERPVAFAANELVLAVPAGSHTIASLPAASQMGPAVASRVGLGVAALAAAGRPGITIAIGEPTVPVGAYTRQLLNRLPVAEGNAILANATDVEPDVSGIVGKLTQGAVDAGFVYATDVAAAKGALRAIPLPAALRPSVAYAAAVVRGSAHARQARAFLAGLLHGPGRRDLLAAGFHVPQGAS